MVQTDCLTNGNKKPQLIIISGPTAVGKSGFAVRLANDLQDGFNKTVEIISADSMQIYRKLDIGTGKITLTERKGIRHHMIDIVEPSDDYSVGRYVDECKKIIYKLTKEQKIIMVVGGTGFYINSLINGYNLAGIGKNEELRQKYDKLAETEGVDALYGLLLLRDPASAGKISKNDKKRIVRALEIFDTANEPMSQRLQHNNICEFDCLLYVLTRERQELYNGINKRVDAMIAAGLEYEVKPLIKYRDCLSMQAIGYKEFVQYFDGEVDKDAAIELIKKRSRNYAKRQMTFFRGIKNEKHFFDAQEYDAVKNSVMSHII